MRLEMIGVQFDQAGHHQVAAGVLAAIGRVALAEFGDAAIGKRNPAALDHAIRQHDAGVAEDGFRLCRHLEASFFRQRQQTRSRR